MIPEQAFPDALMRLQQMAATTDSVRDAIIGWRAQVAALRALLDRYEEDGDDMVAIALVRAALGIGETQR